MAQKSGSKRSKFGFPRHHPGCIESLLQFAVFQGSWQQRLHLKKMIAYKRHSDHIPRPPKIKVPKVQHCFVKENSDSQVEQCKLPSPTKSPKKSPTKSPRKDLFKPLKLRKKSTEKGHRRCITSLPPPPTTSRLIRTVSMHHKNFDCNYDQNTAKDISFSLNSIAPNTKIEKSEHQKTCEHCGSVSGLKMEEQIHQSKDLLDFLEFFNQNKNLLMSIARNPQILLSKDIEDSKSIKSDIKKAMKDNKKEVMHIANDGFLHKLPYGQKDIITDSPKRNFRKEIRESKMKRSSSLIDSLDKYSNMFDCMAKEEIKPADGKTSDLVFKRIHSSPEIVPYYSLFVPPFLGTRSSPDIKAANFSADLKPLDALLDRHDEEAQLLDDPQLCTDKIEKIDTESDEHEVVQPDIIREDEIYSSSFSDEDSSAIDMKQSLPGSSLEPDNIEELKKTEFISHQDIIEVDESDEAYFHFMKEMLEKSGLTSYTEWNSSSKQPTLDPLSLTLSADSINPDQLLLFDLINEALVDAYEASLQLGRECVVGEVWARLKRQLDSYVEVATEDVVAADFRRKNDGWMDLGIDSEALGLEMEDWVIEDVIDEIVLEIGGMSQFDPYY